MVRDWANGKISATKVQEYCFGSQSIGGKGLKSFAKMGKSGNNPQHCQRDLITAVGKPAGCPDLYWAPMHIKDKDGNRCERMHPFLLPHEFFAALWTEKKDFFKKHMLGDEGPELNALQEFWESHSNNSFVQDHPIIGGRPELLPLTLPLGIHGDAGEFSHQENVFVISWNSLVGKGATSKTRFLTTCLNKTELLDDGTTLNEAFEVMAWSFNLLANRQFSITDHTGARFDDTSSRFQQALFKEFPPGRAIVLQLRGDWQFLCQAFGFPQWNAADNMCWVCAAGDNFPWTDMRPEAAWRDTVRTHDMYLQDIAEREAAGGKPLSVLFKIVGFTLECICIDVLHTLDQGVTLHIVGNIIQELLRAHTYGPNVKDGCSRLWLMYKQWCTDNKVASRIPSPFKPTTFRLEGKGKFPKLRCKAAEARHIVPWALKLAQENNTESRHDKLRLACVQSLCDFYNQIETKPRHYSEDDCEEAKQSMRMVCSCYAALSREAHEAGLRLWRLVPKFHLSIHLAEYTIPMWGNPRFYWTYSDEDLVGQVIEVAQSCHPSTMTAVALYKHMAHLSILA